MDCTEVGEKTGRTPAPQEVIDEQFAYYFKKMLLSYMPLEVTPEALNRLTDAQQAAALARLKADLPSLMKELVAEAKEPTLWEKLKTYLAGT